MRFSVDTSSAVPIYAQVIAAVKQAIAAGVMRAGDSLPSLRELASELRVNPMTVARAYRELEQQGVITTEHGRGSVVSAQAGAQSDAYRREALAQLIDRLLEDAAHLGAAPQEIRAALEERLEGVGRGEEVGRRLAPTSRHGLP